MSRGRKVSIGKEVASVRRSLRAFETSLARLATSLGHASVDISESGSAKARHTVKLSPARAKALQLHGRYLGYIRQLKPRQKAEVKGVREKKGVRAAIARARKLAGQ